MNCMWSQGEMSKSGVGSITIDSPAFASAAAWVCARVWLARSALAVAVAHCFRKERRCMGGCSESDQFKGQHKVLDEGVIRKLARRFGPFSRFRGAAVR